MEWPLAGIGDPQKTGLETVEEVLLIGDPDDVVARQQAAEDLVQVVDAGAEGRRSAELIH
jgi:hypothetical protein